MYGREALDVTAGCQVFKECMGMSYLIEARRVSWMDKVMSEEARE